MSLWDDIKSIGSHVANYGLETVWLPAALQHGFNAIKSGNSELVGGGAGVLGALGGVLGGDHGQVIDGHGSVAPQTTTVPPNPYGSNMPETHAPQQPLSTQLSGLLGLSNTVPGLSQMQALQNQIGSGYDQAMGQLRSQYSNLNAPTSAEQQMLRDALTDNSNELKGGLGAISNAYQQAAAHNAHITAAAGRDAAAAGRENAAVYNTQANQVTRDLHNAVAAGQGGGGLAGPAAAIQAAMRSSAADQGTLAKTLGSNEQAELRELGSGFGEQRMAQAGAAQRASAQARAASQQSWDAQVANREAADRAALAQGLTSLSGARLSALANIGASSASMVNSHAEDNQQNLTSLIGGALSNSGVLNGLVAGRLNGTGDANLSPAAQSVLSHFGGAGSTDTSSYQGMLGTVPAGQIPKSQVAAALQPILAMTPWGNSGAARTYLNEQLMKLKASDPSSYYALAAAGYGSGDAILAGR